MFIANVSKLVAFNYIIFGIKSLCSEVFEHSRSQIAKICGWIVSDHVIVEKVNSFRIGGIRYSIKTDFVVKFKQFFLALNRISAENSRSTNGQQCVCATILIRFWAERLKRLFDVSERESVMQVVEYAMGMGYSDTHAHGTHWLFH